jgi:hypothetical protein
MKCVLCAVALTLLAIGCSSPPLALAPVGPNPAALNDQTPNGQLDGQLEVFSALSGHSEGDNPAWFQHVDYAIYSVQGRCLKHVYNIAGYYSRRPCIISLPAGQYVVKTRAKDYQFVEVPIVIDQGRRTRVHLDDAWRPSNISGTALVALPTGYPVGWAASAR